MGFQGIAIWSDLNAVIFNNPYFAASYDNTIVVFCAKDSQHVPVYKEIADRKIKAMWWEGPVLCYCTQGSPNDERVSIDSKQWAISRREVFTNTALVFPKLSGKVIPEMFTKIEGISFNKVDLDEIPSDIIGSSNSSTSRRDEFVPQDRFCFSRLKDKIQRWAKRACVEKISPTEILAIKEMLSMVLLKGYELPDELQQKHPQLLLYSLITHDLYTKVTSLVFKKGFEKNKALQLMSTNELMSCKSLYL